MRTRLLFAIVVMFGFVLAAGCGDGGGGRTITLITHDSFDLSEELVRQFERDNNARLNILKRGDAGAMVTTLILTRSRPEGDVVFGIDNTFLSRALEADLFEPYTSPLLEKVPSELRVEGDPVTPIDVGYVNFNYDIGALREANLQPPQRLEDLTDPRWRGLVVVQNPQTSSPGLAFLIATVSYFGEGQYLDWWRAMRANGLVVTDGWETAYYQHFTLNGGQQPIVLSYSSSPAFEQIFATPPRDDAPTGNILPPKGVFRQVEYAGILKAGGNKELARKLIDFLLSQPVQEDIPLQMAVYPVNQEAALPEAFERFGRVDVPVADISAEQIARDRDRWIEEWTRAVLR
jgi:thiamine transport system substrate-binding protein